MISHHKKGFSLIELLLVITIILILFLASKNLFQTPNKYLIDGEACVNTVHGKLSQFFYQGITGKDKTINNITYEPDQYKINIKGGAYSEIGLYISTGNNTPIKDSSIIISSTGSTIPSCNTNTYIVYLSGSDVITPFGISINLNKNLDNESGKIGMSLCKGNNCSGIFSTKIDYIICKKTNNTIDLNSCRHTFSTRFDTATQSIKSNRCLNILYNQSCTKWSIDNF